MAKQVMIPGKEFLKFLQHLGFQTIRIRGSHHRMKHSDGRVTTIPVHKKDPIAKGLLRKIVREDLDMDLQDFTQKYQDWK